ncbi:MAG TPA: hypothetical protein VI636_23470 [Candidatus Angelobacter sp.]
MSQPSPPRTVREELEWFVQNIEIQLEDAKLEKDEIEIALYWDTSDVRKAVLGMAGFYDADSTFNAEDFRSRNTLVISLAAAGWLGQMQMLQPHQSELLNLISMGFGLADRKVPPGGIGQFLRNAEFIGTHNIMSFENAKEEEINRLVEEQAGDAERLFKAVQAISGTWETRLMSWHKSEHLKLRADPEFEFAVALRSELFDRLLQHFEKARPDFSINNYTDALAMCYLHQRKMLFEQGKSNLFPRFFASSPTFEVGALAHLDGSLFAEAIRRKQPVLCDVDYYIFRATFNPKRSDKVKIKAGKSLADFEPIVRDLRTLLDSPEPIPQNVLEEMRIDDRRIKDVIHELRQFLFLEHVWLPYAATELVKAANEHLNTARELANNQNFKRSVKEAIEEAMNALRSNVHEYRKSSRLFRELKQALAEKRKHFRDADPEVLDVFKTFGLLRFGIPSSVQPAVKRILAMLLTTAETSENTALSDFFSAHRIVVRADSPEALAKVLAVLWVYGLDEHLDEVLSKRREINRWEPDVEHPWVLAFHAAALFRHNRRGLDMKKGKLLLRILEKRLGAATLSLERAQLASGTAYLNFHYWVACGGRALWRDTQAGNAQITSDASRSFRHAIQYARIACQEKIQDPRLRAYVLNQLFYYLIEGSTNEEFAEAQSLIGEIRDLKATKRAAWDYRYDDTLARYNHRRSVLAKSPEGRRELLELAKKYSTEAVQHSFGDPEVERYHEMLVELTS